MLASMNGSAPEIQAIRDEFPALRRLRRGMPPIYLNSTCMTLRPQPVIDAITEYYTMYPTCGGGRVSGPHVAETSWFQGELRERELASREAVRALLNARDVREIVWTRNSTEAINIVASGLALEPGDEVLSAEREHNSNLVPWLEAERRLRSRSGDAQLSLRKTFDLAADGSFDLGSALAEVTPRTKVIALGHTSNLDGTTITDDAIRVLSKRVHENGGVFVLDAAQSVPHRSVDVLDLGVDFLAMSLHKMCGPTGMGVLYGRYDQLSKLVPFVVGGDTVRDTWQDRVEYKDPPGRFEAGLQHYAGIAATASAVNYVSKRVGYEWIESQERKLMQRLDERLRPLENDHFWLLGDPDPLRRSAVTTMASGSGAMMNAIERTADREANIMVRRGMFCVNAYLHKRFAHVGSEANNVRVSVYFYNTLDECDAFCDIVERIVKDPLAHLDAGA